MSRTADSRRGGRGDALTLTLSQGEREGVRGGDFAAEALLARAMVWRWVGQAFWYPDGAFLTELRSAEARREMKARARASRSRALARALAEVWQAADRLEEEPIGLREEHTYLFARQVKAPPHETSYVAGPIGDRAQERAEVASFYAAFGFQTSAERPELPDHVSVECEFAAALLAKEVYAEAHGWEEQADVARDGRATFVAEHLAKWLPAFSERLGQHSRVAFYPAVARLAVALAEADGVETERRRRRGTEARPVGRASLPAPADTEARPTQRSTADTEGRPTQRSTAGSDARPAGEGA